jgi:hypothetical protein
MGQAVRTLGLEIRVGVHAGKCELLGDAVGGIAVHHGTGWRGRSASLEHGQ